MMTWNARVLLLTAAGCLLADAVKAAWRLGFMMTEMSP